MLMELEKLKQIAGGARTVARGVLVPTELLNDAIDEIERLRLIESAARNLDATMKPHSSTLLFTAGSDNWDWAWDQLADVLSVPNMEFSREPRSGESAATHG